MSILDEENLDLDVEVEFLRLYIGFESVAFRMPFFLPEQEMSITNELWKFDVSHGNNEQWTSIKFADRAQSSFTPFSSCSQGGYGRVA